MLSSPVRKYSHSGKTCGKCAAMGVDVYAVSQSAHNNRIGSQSGKVAGERSAYFPAVFGAMACAYNRYYSSRIEIGVAFVEQNERRVVTSFQPRGIVGVAKAETLYSFGLRKLHFPFSKRQELVQFSHRLGKFGRSLGNNGADVFTVFPHGSCAPRSPPQFQSICRSVFENKGYGGFVKGFLRNHKDFSRAETLSSSSLHSPSLPLTRQTTSTLLLKIILSSGKRKMSW